MFKYESDENEYESDEETDDVLNDFDIRTMSVVSEYNLIKINLHSCFLEEKERP